MKRHKGKMKLRNKVALTIVVAPFAAFLLLLLAIIIAFICDEMKTPTWTEAYQTAEEGE